MRVAVIGGTGKMGRWFARYLVKDGKEVIITGRDEKKLLEVKNELGVETATSLEAARNADVVLICVSIENVEEVVQHLSPYLSSKHLVFDITSVKKVPVEIMHRYIKEAVALGVHPMFGPGAGDIANQNFVLTPTNDTELALANKVKEYLEARNARAVIMSPGEHDRIMAVVLGLVHFIAIVSADTLLGFDKFKSMESVSGSTFKLLLTLAESVITEDPELYASLQMNLPGLVDIQGMFRKNAGEWAEIVRSGQRQEFIKRMSGLKDRMEKSTPGFEKAYEKMYKLLEEY